MAVNVSAYQFAQPDCVKQVVRILRETGMRPADLRLEITESVLMENPESAMLKLRSLKELGIGIAIDDFGTGYSSLAYLQRFPLDVLKVDRGFVSGMDEHGNKMMYARWCIWPTTWAMPWWPRASKPWPSSTNWPAGLRSGQGFFYAKPLEEPDVLGLLDRTWGDWPNSEAAVRFGLGLVLGLGWSLDLPGRARPLP
jgi:EAL domain-containing protein (putative c-di-GMP-specific phosphodiesterase class I)